MSCARVGWAQKAVMSALELRLGPIPVSFVAMSKVALVWSFGTWTVVAL